jgi:hypothetical protein
MKKIKWFPDYASVEKWRTMHRLSVRKQKRNVFGHFFTIFGIKLNLLNFIIFYHLFTDACPPTDRLSTDTFPLTHFNEKWVIQSTGLPLSQSTRLIDLNRLIPNLLVYLN